MRPTTQTNDGNCLGAVLASILHVPLEQIPKFSGEDWTAQLNRWLQPYGLAYVQIRDFERWSREMEIAGCHHELTGASKRDPSKLHATVGVDGRMAHDPDPARHGIREVRYSGLFVALRPWEVVERAGLVLREKAA